MAELRTNTGRPMTPAESIRLYRADAKSLWQRAPWFPAMTIWLAPKLEVDLCRRLPASGPVPVPDPAGLSGHPALGLEAQRPELSRR